MSKSSITKKAYFKIAKLSIAYALLLTFVVLSTSFYYFKSTKTKNIEDEILLSASSLSDYTININIPTFLKEIQNKTLLQEIAIYTQDCTLQASTSLAIPNLCFINSSGFDFIETSINSKALKIFYKFNYPLNLFIKTNLNPILIIFSIFCIITSLILYSFLQSSILRPIKLLKMELKRSKETDLPIEFDFIGNKLHELKHEISLIEKDRLYFNLARQVVHDIRNPIAFLKTMNANESLDLISLNKAIEEIEYQIDNLLSPSNKHSSLLNFTIFFEELSKGLKLLFSLKVNLEINLGPYPLVLSVNQFDLKNIFSNLAKNSYEAGAKTIWIQVKRINNFVEFIFTDDGAGISIDSSKKLFLKNFTTKKDGNGIGLNSLKSFIETHGGLFEYIPTFTLGAQFSFRIPFSSQENSLVMIDDDKFIRQAWKLAADKKGVTLFPFASINDFLKSSYSIPKDTPIYVDSNLGSEKGERDSEIIYKNGFKYIFLATSYDDIDLGLYPWLTATASKHPPF